MNERLSRLVVAALGVLALVTFFLSCLQRLPSALELGNGEGSLMDHAVRLAHGQKLYDAPSFKWVPLAYMPGMPILCSWLVRIFGEQFWIGRAVDLLAAAGLTGAFVLILRAETRSWALGLAASGLFMMGQGFTRGCYDVWRPDMPMLAIAFSAAAVLRFSTGNRGAILSAALFALAFVFKQHAVVLGLSLVPYLFFADRRRTLVYLLALGVFCGGIFGLLRVLFGPWMPFYTYDVPSHWSTFERFRIQHYIGGEAFGRFAMLNVPAALALSTRPWRERSGLWWWLALGGMGTGIMATLDPYAAYHTLMLGFATFCMVGAVALHRLGTDLPAAHRGAYGWAVVIVLFAQMSALPFSPRAIRAHATTIPARDEFLQWIRGRKDVIVIYHGRYTWAAGQGTCVSMLPLDDVVRARGNGLLKRDPQYFEKMFARLRSGPNRPVLVSDTTLEATSDAARELWASLAPGYRLEGTLPFARRIAPVNTTNPGESDTPKYVYVPVEPAEAATDSTPAR